MPTMIKDLKDIINTLKDEILNLITNFVTADRQTELKVEKLGL
jgi:septum formation topological specificity factor MinE